MEVYSWEYIMTWQGCLQCWLKTHHHPLSPASDQIFNYCATKVICKQTCLDFVKHCTAISFKGSIFPHSKSFHLEAFISSFPAILKAEAWIYLQNCSCCCPPPHTHTHKLGSVGEGETRGRLTPHDLLCTPKQNVV